MFHMHLFEPSVCEQHNFLLDRFAFEMYILTDWSVNSILLDLLLTFIYRFNYIL